MLPHPVFKRLRRGWRLGLAAVAAVILTCAFLLGYGPYPVSWHIPPRIQLFAIASILALVVVAWSLRRLATNSPAEKPRRRVALSWLAYFTAFSITWFGFIGALVGAAPKNIYPPCLVAGATLAILKPFESEAPTPM